MDDTGPRRLLLRDADAEDAPAIARLHAASWRATYRDVLSADWLASRLDEDRLALWRSRLEAASDRPHVILAVTARAPEAGGPSVVDATTLAGFACLYPDAHPSHGALLENLHVAGQWRGQGLGARLLQAAARRAEAASPGTAFHLSVVRANAAARGFYERLGARALDVEDWHAPDGRVVPCDVMGWPRAADLG